MKSKYPIHVTLSFTKIEIFEDYLISTVNEGIIFDLSHLNELQLIFDVYFQNKYFGFISNRENDYTVNPNCFNKLPKNSRLLGVAILCHSKESYENTQFIKFFYSRPFKSFFLLKDCFIWFNNLKKKQTCKPDFVSLPNARDESHHLSKYTIARIFYLPTLLHWAGTLKSRFTWHCTA